MLFQHVAASAGFDAVVKALVAGGARLTANRYVLSYYAYVVDLGLSNSIGCAQGWQDPCGCGDDRSGEK